MTTGVQRTSNGQAYNGHNDDRTARSTLSDAREVLETALPFYSGNEAGDGLGTCLKKTPPSAMAPTSDIDDMYKDNICLTPAAP